MQVSLSPSLRVRTYPTPHDTEHRTSQAKFSVALGFWNHAVVGGGGGRESEQSGEIEQVAQQAETDCGDEDDGQESQGEIIDCDFRSEESRAKHHQRN